MRLGPREDLMSDVCRWILVVECESMPVMPPGARVVEAFNVSAANARDVVVFTPEHNNGELTIRAKEAKSCAS